MRTEFEIAMRFVIDAAEPVTGEEIKALEDLAHMFKRFQRAKLVQLDANQVDRLARIAHTLEPAAIAAHAAPRNGNTKSAVAMKAGRTLIRQLAEDARMKHENDHDAWTSLGVSKRTFYRWLKGER